MRVKDLLFRSQEAALLSWHLCSPVVLLKIQGQDKVPGLSSALSQNSRQCLGKGSVNPKATESLDSTQNGMTMGLFGGGGWAGRHPAALQVKSEPFIALVSPSHTHTHPFMSMNHSFPNKKHELFFFFLTPTTKPSSLPAAYHVASDLPKGGPGMVELLSQSPGGSTLAAICSEITS